MDDRRAGEPSRESTVTDVILKELADSRREDIRLRRQEFRWRKVRFGLVVLGVGALYLFNLSILGAFRGHGFDGPYVAMVKIEGPIEAGHRADAARINPALLRAFEDEDASGVVIVINSPGGSPVQAGLIRKRIAALRAEHPGKSVIAIGEDYLASAAYLVALGTPEIYVQEASITGSIGVRMDGYGLEELAARLGIERRIVAAGEHKVRLDPFLPFTEESREKFEAVAGEVHQQFIAAVKASRGERLQGDPGELFSGDIWTGASAVQLGLVDGIGDTASVLRERFGTRAARDYTPRPAFLERASRVIGATLAETLVVENGGLVLR